MDESDRDLIQACRRGDLHSWERLLDKYERLVFSIPLNYGLSHDDAADISQLTFTILIQSLDKLHEDSRLGPWLATIARRHTWRWLKRVHRESTGEYEDLAASAVLLGKSSASPIDRWELLEWLNYGLALIGERCHDLLLALYFDPQEPSYDEVAARLGMPVGSLGPTRARCLEHLKRVLLEA
jgi:RNA polymerase sigma factor (sigma-70 family)